MKHGQNHVTTSSLRKSVSLNCGEQKITDDTFKNECDINYIMKKYQQTGVLPHTADKMAQYLDVSDVPSLEQAYEQIQQAQELFMELPSALRKRLNNDPRNLVDYISDPENKQELIKLGVLNQIDNANDLTNAKKNDTTTILDPVQKDVV